MSTSNGAGSIQRPGVLIALVVLIGLLGATVIGLGLLFMAVDYSQPRGPMSGLGALFGGMIIVPGVVELVLAYGLWKLKRWAWWLCVAVHAVAAVVVMTMLSIESTALPLLFAIGLLGIVACLLMERVRHAFRVGG